MQEINSKSYWDQRFEGDWSTNAGDKQTAFFAHVVIKALPQDLAFSLKNNSHSFLDVGCALGDALPIWERFFNDKTHLKGIDFSSNAIQSAKTRFPDFDFEATAIGDCTEKADVVFCSNVLEHLDDGYEKLEDLAKLSNKYLVIAVPYAEEELISEHVLEFEAKRLPTRLQSGLQLVCSSVIDTSNVEETQWNGHQLVLCYAAPTSDELSTSKLVDLWPIDDHELISLKRNLTATEKALQASRSQNMADQRAIETLDTTISDLNQRIKEIEAQKRAVESELNSASNSIQYMQSVINDYSSSSSWKLTKPLRQMGIAARFILNASRKVAHRLRTQGFKETIRWGIEYFKRKPVVQLDETTIASQLEEILSEHPSKTIVIFPPLVQWDLHLYQRPQHIATRLAKRGYLYFFCTPRPDIDQISGYRKVADSCYVTDQYQTLCNLNRDKIHHLYSTDVLTGPDVIQALLQRGEKILYEYVDEIHEDISGIEVSPEIREKHQTLISNEKVALITTADKLYEEAAAVRSENFSLVTNGVEVSHFSVKRDPKKIPDELKGFVNTEKKVIGYFGAFAKWFDYHAVVHLATHRPDYNILLLGLDYDGSIKEHKLEQYSNIKAIGPIDYKQLPNYACWFDVSTIPFLINDITESTSPIKLFEYMALGKPIVTSKMPECLKYRSTAIYDGTADFTTKVDAALKRSSDSEYLQILKEEAQDNDWSQKADKIVDTLASTWTK